jgi:hypothetical protein
LIIIRSFNDYNHNVYIKLVIHRIYEEKNTMPRENMIQLNVRVPPSLKELMKRFIDCDTHKDVSELTRDAIREKIKREAPQLYTQLFAEVPPQ